MIMKEITGAIYAVLFGALLLTGCSGDDEKGAVEQASDKVAGKAVEYINKPLDKAKQSQAVQNAQNQKMEDMVQESGE
jgi:PBP1b-binding outer membrane lipoprotein LpoB